MCTYSTCDYYGNGGCAYERIMNCLLPCKQGSYCHFRPGTGRKDNSVWDSKEAQALYNSGATDTEIAQALDVVTATVSKWRREHGLPYNSKYVFAFDDIKAFELYEQGLTDLQVAQALEVSESTVGRWRRKEGLIPNRLKKRSVLNVV